MDLENGKNENVAFIQDPRPAVKYHNNGIAPPTRGAYSTYNQSKSGCCGRTCCCCTTSWKCCIIVTVVIVVVIVAILGGGYAYMRSRFTGTATSEDAEEWEKMLSTADSNNTKLSGQNLIPGKYNLVSYDENYSDYLKGMGIPFFVVPMILGSKETITITKPDDPDDGFWSFMTETEGDIIKREKQFKIGEQFEMVWGRNNGIMHSTCETPEPNILDCVSEERVKGWKLRSTSVFSSGGFINTRHFVTKDIKTKKYYQREGSVMDASFVSGEGVVTIAPDSVIEDGDVPFSDDNSDSDDSVGFDFDSFDDMEWGDFEDEKR